MDHFWIALMLFILCYIMGNCSNRVIEGYERPRRDPGRRQRERVQGRHPDPYDDYTDQLERINAQHRAQQRAQQREQQIAQQRPRGMVVRNVPGS